jgi:hypothetical protein
MPQIWHICLDTVDRHPTWLGPWPQSGQSVLSVALPVAGMVARLPPLTRWVERYSVAGESKRATPGVCRARRGSRGSP